MISHENMNIAAVGAKTARACDHCIRKRARWYCAADDAFLCQACDGSVHSANSLARRHERVRLKTASLKCPSEERPCIPSWHRGHNRRARTPRHGKHQPKLGGHVPELGRSSNSTTTSNEDYEHDQMQLLYRVPIMDPFVSELCNSTATSGELAWAGESKYTEMILVGEDGQDDKCNESLLSFDLDMDIDMAEFAADVETLLGKGLDGEIYGKEELGLLECNGRGPLVKAKEEIVPSAPNMEGEMEVIREPFELCFDYNSPASCEENDAKEAGEAYRTTNEEKSERRMSLRLDYEAISAAWASQGSPWMNGEKPKINPNDGWLHGTMEGVGTIRAFGEVGMTTGQGPSGDGGREARVLRYREKRRTRLFSKKIRYEVRKLNAEKRPRMKGRFVKRSSFNTTPTPFPLLSK